MQIPEGKTKAIIKRDAYQTELKKDDRGYIDGYVQGADSRPCVVFVRNDGHIDLVMTHDVTAIV